MIDIRSRSIYALVDPRTHKVRYVGQTVRPEGHRLDDHVRQSRRGGDSWKCKWIRTLLVDGLVPDVEILEQGSWSQDSADDREAYWIECFRMSLMGQMTNHLSRGSGTCGGPQTADSNVRRSMSISAWLATDEGRAQRAEQMRERYKDPEARKRDTAAMRAWTDDPKNKSLISETRKSQFDDTARALIGKQSRSRWTDPEYSARKTLQSDEYRARRSAIAKQISARKRTCNVCGHTTSPNNMSRHQKFHGHSGWTEVT